MSEFHIVPLPKQGSTTSFLKSSTALLHKGNSSFIFTSAHHWGIVSPHLSPFQRHLRYNPKGALGNYMEYINTAGHYQPSQKHILYNATTCSIHINVRTQCISIGQPLAAGYVSAIKEIFSTYFRPICPMQLIRPKGSMCFLYVDT